MRSVMSDARFMFPYPITVWSSVKDQTVIGYGNINLASTEDQTVIGYGNIYLAS